MNHFAVTKAWILANPSDEELTQVDLDIELDVDHDGATIEGYSVLGKSIRLESLRDYNKNIDKSIDSAVNHYLANHEEGDEYD